MLNEFMVEAMRRLRQQLSILCLFSLLGPCLQARAEDDVKRDFSAGAGVGGVGVYADAGEDAEVEGPQAIFSDENGQIYLLDQNNGRILKFDPSRNDAPAQTLKLPEGVNPTDLVVSKGEIHVWDGGVVTLQAAGKEDAPTRGLSITRSAEPPEETTRATFEQMGSVDLSGEPDATPGATRSLTPQGRREQLVATRGQGAVTARFSPTQGEAGVRIAVAPRGGGAMLAQMELVVGDRLGSVELLEIDKEGRFFVYGENIPGKEGGESSAFVARFSPRGAIEGVYDLPLGQSTGLSRRFVTVSPAGDVFFLRNTKDSSQVLGVGFRAIRKGRIQALPSASASLSFNSLPKIHGGAAGVRPLTRQQVLETGFQFANVRWTVTPTAYGHDPDTACSGFNRVRRPGYLNGKVNKEVVGVPYCWGCHGSLPIIAAMLNRGHLAGNVCTRNNPRAGVAGVDCSAFVSAAWGLSTHFSTIAIPAISKHLPSGWDLLPGDALNKPGSHVMLFVRFTPDKRVEVLESSTGGCNGKVCRNIYPLGSLLARGYLPVRYRGLLADTSTSTEAARVSPATPLGRSNAQ
jgi:hypothetical protein